MAARTVSEIAVALNERYPGVYDRLMEPDGSLRRYVNVFVEGEDGRWQASAETEVEDGRQVWIVPNIAGGRLPEPELRFRSGRLWTARLIGGSS